MNIHDLAASTTLVRHSFGHWGVVKKHAPKTKEINQAEGTKDVAICNVRVCTHEALGLISTHHTSVRSALNALCGSTVDDGLKMIRVGKIPVYNKIFNDGQPEHDRLASWFLGDYDTEYALAPSRLNGFYLPRAWPHRDKIAGKFRYFSRYLECPTTGAWKEWLEESAQVATARLRDQLEKSFRRMQESCINRDYNGRLYDTVFSGIREFLANVPDLDFAENSEVRRICAIAKPLADFEADEVKDNKALRQSIADRAGSIADMFGAISI